MARVAFLGTPAAAIPTLAALPGVAEVALVVTRPDRPRGRSGRPRPSPVREAAEAAGLPVAAPERPAGLGPLLSAAGPLDLCVVVAFGMLVPPDALAVPRHGHVNVHFSLLPRWRGAAPVQHAVLAGDRLTGVTLIRLDEGLDTGPILAMRAGRLGPEETAGQVTERLARSGAGLVSSLLPGILSGDVVAVAQPEDGVTSAPKLGAEERRLRLRGDPRLLARRVLALSPTPGAHALLEGEVFKVLRARPAPGASPPGELLLVEGRLVCGTGDGQIELVEVQPAGRRAMGGAEWARGRRGDLGRLE